MRLVLISGSLSLTQQTTHLCLLKSDDRNSKTYYDIIKSVRVCNYFSSHCKVSQVFPSVLL